MPDEEQRVMVLPRSGYIPGHSQPFQILTPPSQTILTHQGDCAKDA